MFRLLVIVLPAAVAVLGAVAWARGLLRRLWYGPRRPRLSLPARVRRRLHPGPGWAGWWNCWRDHGLPAARTIARYARPSLPPAVLRPGRRDTWREYATFLGWAGRWPFRWRIYAHLESLVLMFAAPQDGKTQAAAGQLIDAPGPVVAASVRADLAAATAALRAVRGRVDLWDPEGVTGLASTFRWNLVAGCEDIATAVRRAGALVEAVAGKAPTGRRSGTTKPRWSWPGCCTPPRSAAAAWATCTPGPAATTPPPRASWRCAPARPRPRGTTWTATWRWRTAPASRSPRPSPGC
jgi:hypothetical protein